jgi:hypothetical protein
LRVCESRVVRRIFNVGGREGGIEGCRRLCSEFHVCYCAPDIINIITEKKKYMHNM